MLMKPDDRHNRTLIDNVHPADWVNPTPQSRYNLVVIGAGSGGLITASLAAGLGAKVALIERHLLGGDCLNVGCVPSKGVIRASRIAAEVQLARTLGLELPEDANLDFGLAMARMRGIRADISHEDSARRYTDELGVDVFFGQASFSGPQSVDVDGTELCFARCVIASGARAFQLPVAGFAEVGALDNETVFTLTERPERLAVIGAGPIGCELAQAFRRLGSEVVLIHEHEHILDREDRDAAAIVQEVFRAEGIELELGARVVAAALKNGQKQLIFQREDGSQGDVLADQILVGVGRQPNVEGMNLEKVGVEYDTRRGIQVDDQLRTTARNIYAVGDVCMAWKFTHAADAAAKIVVRNALFPGNQKLSALTMPWATYTSPEIAHVGLYAHEAEQRGIAIDTYQVPLDQVNRAVADGEANGFLKVLTVKGKDRILGATLVASHAGDMISQITQAMVTGKGLSALSGVIFPYPTQAEIIKRASSAYLKGRFTPFARRVLERYFAFRR